jgi:hypothetical protein
MEIIPPIIPRNSAKKCRKTNNSTMNAKQTAPLLVTLAPLAAIAPPILIGSAIGFGVLLLIKSLMDSDADKKPETTSPDSGRKEPETAAFRTIQAVPPVSAPVLSAPSVAVPPVAVRPASAPVVRLATVAPVPQVAASAKPAQIGKKIVSCEDMARVFNNGTRTLTRTAAVMALKQLGFGKTAAYSALSPDGRFNAWLHCDADGIISWTH